MVSGAVKCICGGLFIILAGIMFGRSVFGGNPTTMDYILDAFGVFLVVFGIGLLVFRKFQDSQ